MQDTLSSDHVQRLWDQCLTHEGLLDQPRQAWSKSLGDRGAPMRSHSTRQYFLKLGIAQSFSRPRTPNDNPRIEAHFGTVNTHPSWVIDLLAAVTYFTGFCAWHNNVQRLTTLDMLTPNQVHSGQTATLLAKRHARQSQTLTSRRDACHTLFALEELIAELLPDVSQYPAYAWAGRGKASAIQATPLA
ncbi:MAG: hypothetical protein NTU91_13175 [Chloroflexi bacterium]|nr:hypothetical protein [Chloroflexota bacterium]